MEKYIGHPYASLRMGYNNVDAELLFVEYNDIVNNSQLTLDRICDFIEVDRYTIDTENLQPMDENDQYHGGIQGLHYVRPTLSKTSPEPEQVIGRELTKLYTDMKLEFWRK
jgi:galactose mutarotase-like enzyme